MPWIWQCHVTSPLPMPDLDQFRSLGQLDLDVEALGIEMQ
jgi:hypothetical protein